MNQETKGFIVGMATMSVINHIAYRPYRRRVVKTIKAAQHVMKLAQILIDVSEERCLDLFADERVRRVVDDYTFERIVSKL